MSDGSSMPHVARTRSALLVRLPPVVVDVALTVLALGGQASPFAFTAREDGSAWTAIEFFPALVVALPVLGRRWAPIPCLLLSAAGIAAYAVVGSHGPEQPVWYGALMLMYAVADRAPRWPRRATLVLAAAGITIIGGLFGSFAVGIREAILWGAAYALGRSATLRRANAAMLAREARRAARERELDAERAVQHERARIARDMHDILAHAISLMVVQAEAGAAAGSSVPGRAVAIFDTIADAGRDAMTQLRGTLGLLADPDAHPRAPTLAGLPGLVAGTGLAATLRSSGTPRRVSTDVEVAVYRIVQEALTNVLKHAEAHGVHVDLCWEDARLRILVEDDGAPPRVPRGEGRASGAGLLGIRARAEACGGTATFGPRVGSPGFRVDAMIPTP